MTALLALVGRSVARRLADREPDGSCGFLAMANMCRICCASRTDWAFSSYSCQPQRRMCHVPTLVSDLAFRSSGELQDACREDAARSSSVIPSSRISGVGVSFVNRVALRPVDEMRCDRTLRKYKKMECFAGGPRVKVQSDRQEKQHDFHRGRQQIILGA